MHRHLDELLPVYIVFRTPLLEDDVLKTYLSRLVLNLEAIALSTAPSPEQEPKSGPPKELIYSDSIKDANVPTIVRREDGEDGYSYVIWTTEVFIGKTA